MNERDLGVTFESLYASPSLNGLTRPKAVRGAGTKMINMGELFAHDRIGDCDMDRVPLASTEDRFLVQSGDLLFARASLTLEGAGKVSLVCPAKEPRTFESHIIRVRLDRTRVEPGYYYYFFRSPAGRTLIESIVEQVAAAGIRSSDLARLRVPCPDISLQKRVADILGTLDDKIELNRRTNETLEAMARTLFRSWFVDFDPVRVKADGQKPLGLNAAAAKLFPDSFEPSAVGPIPKGWRVGTLAETLAELETGNRPKGGVSGITSGVPSIGAESINGLGVFDFTKTKFVPQAFFDGMGRGHVRSRDVLLYKDGGRPGMFEPHVAMFGDDFPFSVCSINEHVYRLRANDHLSQAFLYFWLSDELALAEMRVKGTGVAVPGLNSTAVRSLKVLVPPKEIVAAFDRFAEPLITAVLRNAKEQVTLTATRDALLPKLLSGEVQA